MKSKKKSHTYLPYMYTPIQRSEATFQALALPFHGTCLSHHTPWQAPLLAEPSGLPLMLFSEVWSLDGLELTNSSRPAGQ